jgi:hypothetical protein
MALPSTHNCGEPGNDAWGLAFGATPAAGSGAAA